MNGKVFGHPSSGMTLLKLASSYESADEEPTPPHATHLNVGISSACVALNVEAPII